MHIGLIGGIDRSAHHYGEMAKLGGHTVECHTGHLNGRGSESLASLVERSDLVVVITDVNSHAGMWSARKLAKARGRRCVLVRRMGIRRFREFMELADLLSSDREPGEPAGRSVEPGRSRPPESSRNHPRASAGWAGAKKSG